MDFLQGKLLCQKKNQNLSADVVLKKKNLILYYFTANQCEACRSFDLKLREVYEKAALSKIEMAIIIVSCDPDNENFKLNIRENYEDWLYIKYEDDLLRLLTYNYGVTSIPTLIVVRKNGNIVTKEGKSDVEETGVNVLVTWSVSFETLSTQIEYLLRLQTFMTRRMLNAHNPNVTSKASA